MKAGHDVIMACRSGERCAAAKADLDARGLAGSCRCQGLDLSSFESSRRFTAELPASPSDRGSSTGRQISVLVNNAATMGEPDGMLPNHFGHFLLTRLLLPHMAPGGRIVTVGSEAHYRGSLEFEADSSRRGRLRLAPPPSNWYRAYARTKLCSLLFTAELQRRLEQRGSSITAYTASPGRVNTNIFHSVRGLLRAPLHLLARAFFQTPAQGAQTVLQTALDPELQGKHVLYSHAMRPKTASVAARDPALAEQLWVLSAREVGLSPEEDARLWPPY